jgi:DNA-directed RNA polymerase subunit RPC12/RpoP
MKVLCTNCKEDFSFDYKPFLGNKITCPYCGKSFEIKNIKYGKAVDWGTCGLLYVFLVIISWCGYTYMNDALAYLFLFCVSLIIMSGIMGYLRYRVLCALIAKFGFIEG